LRNHKARGTGCELQWLQGGRRWRGSLCDEAIVGRSLKGDAIRQRPSGDRLRVGVTVATGWETLEGKPVRRGYSGGKPEGRR
jgi:hypothetical protein